MIKKIVRIFEKYTDCPFCVDEHIKDVTGLEEETIIDFTKLKSESKS